ncbi:hypothetical protein SISSUDRAFT_1045336 [Sistotremastrum suecicum HHB10207 ss-3]|uniref:Transmembrane protein n=1 Tax=Sistotremastrum suecicum HHB10207 ss-3 TaxID=1314776 RepID=A0A166EIZ9_9AGAM|nr:hypothetical protein SISSUDRAFT_1045336 [Sistotremastrum suecicum HHB10207 ss-3]
MTTTGPPDETNTTTFPTLPLATQSTPDIPELRLEPDHSALISGQTSNPSIPAQQSSSLVSESDKLAALPSSATLPRRRANSRTAALDTSRSSSPPAAEPRASSESDRSGRRSTSRTRGVSFEGDRISQSIKNALNLGRGRSSDPVVREYAVDQSRTSTRPNSPSRAVSPLRILWPLRHAISREEPFIPIDPYRLKLQSLFMRKRDVCTHWLDQILRQIVRHFLLRLPSVYFTRVSRVFEDAEISRPEVQRLIEERRSGGVFPVEWNSSTVSPALLRFRTSWEDLIDSLTKEWKTLNIVSALFLTAILTLFQIPEAANDAVTRTAGLMALMCALWSLVFGCIYILRFGTMRSMYKACRWAEEMQNSDAFVFWNVWVLLSTPAAWLAWSLISFCVAMLSYVWSAGDTGTVDPADVKLLTPRQAIGPRTFITAVFTLGLFVFIAVVRTFRSWGDNDEHRLDPRSEASRSKVTSETGERKAKSVDVLVNMA